MKKILFAAALVAVTATSCMTNEEMDVTSGAASTQDGAIAFNSYASGSTKASEITTATLQGETFYIQSYQTLGTIGSEEATANIASGEYLTFNKTSLIWSTNEYGGYFWPKSDSGLNENFFATNASVMDDEDTIAGTALPSFEYTVLAGESMKDILVAQTTNQTEGTVALDFYHALAKVNFSVVGEGDGGEFDYRDENGFDYDGDGVITGADGTVTEVLDGYEGSLEVGSTVYTQQNIEDDDEDWYYTYEGTDLAGNTLTGKQMTGRVSYTYTVKSITVADLHDKATFTFGENKSSSTPGSWAGQAYADENSSSYSYDLNDVTTSLVDTESISLKSDSNSLFIMPQTVDDSYGFTITVEYTVQRNDVEENNYVKGDATTPAVALATIESFTFVENSSTVFAMTIPSPGELITFKSSVSGFDDEKTYKFGLVEYDADGVEDYDVVTPALVEEE